MVTLPSVVVKVEGEAETVQCVVGRNDAPDCISDDADSETGLLLDAVEVYCVLYTDGQDL